MFEKEKQEILETALEIKRNRFLSLAETSVCGLVPTDIWLPLRVCRTRP